MIYTSEFAQREFDLHGESWLQRKFSGKFNTIFDVGANIGEWTKMARSHHPDAEIHLFELVPDTYKRLLNNVKLDPKIIPNGFGLSNTCGTVDVKYVPHFDAMSTIVTDIKLDSTERRKALVFTGDQYVESRQVDQIDYLKIDVEGAEELVLKGFEQTLKSGKVRILQFEYGYISVITKWLLMDSYKYLTPLGFKLGRLREDQIEFHEYTLLNETFVGPDYVAVHESAWKDFGLS